MRERANKIVYRRTDRQNNTITKTAPSTAASRVKNDKIASLTYPLGTQVQRRRFNLWSLESSFSLVYASDVIKTQAPSTKNKTKTHDQECKG